MSAAHGKLPQEAALDKEVRQRHQQHLSFLYTHRLSLLVLLEGAVGTSFEGFREEVLGHILNEFRVYRKTLPASQGRPSELLLQTIYRQLLAGIVHLLRHATSRKALQAELRSYLDYHLKGLEACLAS